MVPKRGPNPIAHRFVCDGPVYHFDLTTFLRGSLMMPSLDDELFELVFERLDSSKAARVSSALGGREAPLPSGDEGVREVILKSLTLGTGVTLSDVHLRLLCYDEAVYDVEVNFRLREAEVRPGHELIAAFHAVATDIAEANGVASYFAGLEPATAEDTRMFTGRQRGPYFTLK